jgi:hypothetical protein
MPLVLDVRGLADAVSGHLVRARFSPEKGRFVARREGLRLGLPATSERLSVLDTQQVMDADGGYERLALQWEASARL